MFSCILFDLDGTISDPKQGICGCVQYALRSFGIEEPELDRLEPFIGPPLAESFMKYYNFTAEQAQEAVEKYRERFSVTGKYENVLYPGMGALLHDLKASGATLAIASSKPTVYVEDILVHFGIREYFDIVVGSELDGRRVHKEEVVAEVLSQLAARGESDPDKMVMIGDRSFDVACRPCMMRARTICRSRAPWRRPLCWMHSRESWKMPVRRSLSGMWKDCEAYCWAARRQETARRQEVARRQEIARRQEETRRQETARRQGETRRQEAARRPARIPFQSATAAALPK